MATTWQCSQWWEAQVEAGGGADQEGRVPCGGSPRPAAAAQRRSSRSGGSTHLLELAGVAVLQQEAHHAGQVLWRRRLEALPHHLHHAALQGRAGGWAGQVLLHSSTGR